MIKILVVEDDESFARFIELELEHESYSVTIADDGRKGLELAIAEEWNIILLDVMLPELNGFEVCRRIRNVKKTPIIMLTARDSVMDRVSGLDSGADDYISKPFAIEELLARIRAMLRRFDNSEVTESSNLHFRDLSINNESRIVKRGSDIIDLTKREYDLLLVFMENVNRVLTREILLDKVWGYDAEVETNVVDVYVRYLRTKLGHSEENYIHTLRGIGYVMR
ncbi:response regulator [Paenibacillus sp. LMG 31456]|uniref:Response regulator n=1 Tax=Paenibacillus foliorum TaxID=2654974 RepID=A0A972JYB8_9BACL|nr:response regulator transcription factor [Paenibacillus foliorum]NOU92391.1 response regulator [Paenibacillus foliorum]